MRGPLAREGDPDAINLILDIAGNHSRRLSTFYKLLPAACRPRASHRLSRDEPHARQGDRETARSRILFASRPISNLAGEVDSTASSNPSTPDTDPTLREWPLASRPPAMSLPVRTATELDGKQRMARTMAGTTSFKRLVRQDQAHNPAPLLMAGDKIPAS